MTEWRESASLIVIAQNHKQTTRTANTKNAEYDYNLLMLKRSDHTAFVQNQTVFPGGMLAAEADESIEWLHYFETCGIKQEALRELVIIDEQRPRILAPQGTGCYDRFFKRERIWAREISLRLTALRETFEEVGILICRKCDTLKTGLQTGETYFEENFDRVAWQKRVHNNPHEFLNLCRELRVIPDLWSLYEWVAWASPAVWRKGHETAFFICFLNRQPNLLAEETEVKECLWKTPAEVLHLYRANEVWFLPPQVYEVSRLLGVNSFNELKDFAFKRSKAGSTLYIGVHYLCSDEIVAVLPGDDFFVADPRQAVAPIPYNGTVQEFRAATKRVHRMEEFANENMKIYLNFKPLNEHLPPVNLASIKQKL